MSSTDVRGSRRMPGAIDRYLSHRSTIATKHPGYRYASDVPTMAESPVAHGSFATFHANCDASRVDNAVLSRKDTVATLKNEPNRAARLSENASCSACSINKYTSSGDDDCPTSNRRCQWTRRAIFLFFLFLWCVPAHAMQFADECAPGLYTFVGRTSPKSDIILEYGQPLRIVCTINMTKFNFDYPGVHANASNIIFLKDASKYPLKNETHVINKTTAVLEINRPHVQSNFYTCKLNVTDIFDLVNQTVSIRQFPVVCLNFVSVGLKPQKPTNFKCISNNWESLTCSWIPQPTNIPTKFSLMFKLPGITGGRNPCPSQIEIENGCMWDTTTDPIYRQPYENYTFVLHAQNLLGNSTFTYKFNHYANVKPAKPTNLKVFHITESSATLNWSVPFPMNNFPPGLHHRIMYQSQWENSNSWQVINLSSFTSVATRSYHFTGLKYANTAYDIRIFLKSAVANDTEDMWSEFAPATFRTLSTIPSRAPKIDIGSFHIIEKVDNRDVFLYWQMISQTEQNGNNFTYRVEYKESDSAMETRHINLTSAYHKFKGFSFKSYDFRIFSQNEVGESVLFSTISVPSKREMPPEPISFTKVVFEGGHYELSWRAPITVGEITNYTIFTCEHNRDSSQCEGYLDWVHIPGNSTVHNITGLNPIKTYQFAIALNSRRGSSGMVWASCTVIHDKVIGKMKSVWINRIGSTDIEVGWKLDCSDRIGIVEGFNIYYCPIMSPLDIRCKSPKLNITIKADPHTMHGTVENLKPYTTYMLTVTVLTKSGEGLQSDALYNTTLEAAPSTPPLNVSITNVTNMTMFVRWDAPIAMNGVLRYYEVYYNERSTKVEEQNYVELTNLLAYTNYSISVTACTVKCSAKSPTKYEITKIGMPGKIATPKVRFMNSSQVLITWDTPQYPAAPEAAYYQIEISHSGEIQNTSGLEMQLPIPIDCKATGQDQAYKFRVRAVNLAPNNMHFTGPWSDFGEGYCISDGPSYVAWVIIWVIGVLGTIAFFMFFLYGFKRMWRKYLAMQDVEVKLPPGLTPNMKLLQKVGEQHIRQPSADSSGCSSAQESVTCSLTAESQVCSDSGTEVDPIAVSPEKLLETLPTWEPTDMRQRSVTREPGLTEDPMPDCWKSYTKAVKSGEPGHSETLSLARSTPNLMDSTVYTTPQHTWSSAGYISMPSSEEMSSNPSPVPRENNITNTSNSSDSGSIPKSIGTKLEEDDDVNVLADTIDDSLIKAKPTSDPYVTLASLEQKQMQKQKLVDNILCNLDEVSAFVEPNKEFTLDKLSHFSTPEKTSKSYVQMGLIDTVLQKAFIMNPVEQPVKSNTMTSGSFALTSVTDSCSQPCVSSFTSPTSLPISFSLVSSTSAPTKPPITVSTISVEAIKSSADAVKENKQFSPQKTLQVSRIPALSEGLTNPCVPASSVRRILQQQENMEPSASIIEDVEKNDENDATYPTLCWQTMDATTDGKEPITKLNPIGTPIMMKHSSGYVSFAENPNQTAFHPQFDKPPQTITNQSDEQYSKVAVVPSTIQ